MSSSPGGPSAWKSPLSVPAVNRNPWLNESLPTITRPTAHATPTMPLTLPPQHLFSNPPTRRILLFPTLEPFSSKSHLPPPPLSVRRVIPATASVCTFHHNPLKFRTHRLVPRADESDSAVTATTRSSDDLDGSELSSFLSLAEVVCIVSSTVVTIALAVNHANLSEMAKKVMACVGVLGLVGGVAIGAWIRRRQWGTLCRESEKGQKLNLIRRVEKLEEDLRSSTTIVRVLSRQLEKLGIRFRVTRKALKEPISETADLAQKNSEATRALAAQGSNLEKELGEIQKVLLAMQEQQQKQLELILAVAKNGKLLDMSQACEEQQDIAKEGGVSNEDKLRETDGAPAPGADKRLDAPDSVGFNSLL